MFLLESLLVALSTYSIVPVPQIIWKEQAMRYAICFFPIVGLLCGVALWSWQQVAMYFAVSDLLFATVAACIPLFVTGGIHMDGYMDTVDALASHQSRERKLEILKDSACGAFAILFCGVYLLLNAGFLYELSVIQNIRILYPVFVLSRVLSALCAIHMPSARTSGMLHAYRKYTAKKQVTIWLLVLLLFDSVILLWISLISGSMILLFAFFTMFLYCRIANRAFGGVTGDTSGFFLQICELACIIGACFGGMLT